MRRPSQSISHSVQSINHSSALNRGLSRRLSIYPIHLSGSPTSNQSARSIDQSVPINQSSVEQPMHRPSQSISPIDQSQSIDHQHHSLSLTQFIHPPTSSQVLQGECFIESEETQPFCFMFTCIAVQARGSAYPIHPSA